MVQGPASELPSFLQTDDGNLSIGALVAVIICAAVATQLFVIGVYILYRRSMRSVAEALEAGSVALQERSASGSTDHHYDDATTTTTTETAMMSSSGTMHASFVDAVIAERRRADSRGSSPIASSPMRSSNNDDNSLAAPLYEQEIDV